MMDRGAPPQEADALAEGRRIYLGNLLYEVKPSDVEDVLSEAGFGNFQKIHISVDPVSGRNPGYCFVDFPDAATAERALTDLTATIYGRTLKVGPCEPKKPRTSRWNSRGDGQQQQPFQRWGDWKSSEGGEARSGTTDVRLEQGPRAAIRHFDKIVEEYDGKRLYLGGLGKVIDQESHQAEVRELLAEFNPVVISKRITPNEKTLSKPGNHHYCFIDFETKEEAAKVVEALNRKNTPSGLLKVSIATPIPDKLLNRRYESRDGAHVAGDESPRRENGRQFQGRGDRNGQGQGRGEREQREPREPREPRQPQEPSRAAVSMNWRRKD